MIQMKASPTQLPHFLLLGMYVVIMFYFASLIIFARPDNVIYSNLANVVMVGYFLFLEFLYSDRQFYFNSVTVGYILFFLYCAASLFWSIDYAISSEMIGRMVKITINLLLVYNILKKYRMFSALFFGLFIGTLVNVLIAVGLFPVSFVPYFEGTIRFMGTTINPNITSAFMFYTIFVTILWMQITKNKLFLLLGIVNIVLSYYVILITVSRTGLVVAFALIFFFIIVSFWDKERRAFMIWSGIVLLIMALLFIDDQKWMQLAQIVEFGIERIGYIFASLSGESVEHSAEERLEFIATALQTFKENPLFGTGVDTVRSYQGVYSHNNFTELLADCGLTGLVLYYAIHFFVLVKAWYVKDQFIRFLLIFFVLAVFVYDMGGVSYYDKLNLMMLVIAAFVAELFWENKEVAKNTIL